MNQIQALPTDKCEDCGVAYIAPVQSHHSRVECLKNQLKQAEEVEQRTREKRAVVMGYVIHRVQVLLEATNDHARNVAMGKLKDAYHALERFDR